MTALEKHNHNHQHQHNKQQPLTEDNMKIALDTAKAMTDIPHKSLFTCNTCGKQFEYSTNYQVDTGKENKNLFIVSLASHVGAHGNYVGVKEADVLRYFKLVS
jgi:transcription initiation factor IIE alpha subunit